MLIVLFECPHFLRLSTYQIKETAKSYCRGHPDTKPKRNDVQHVGCQLEQDMEDKAEAAW
jgi:hypothetical protein